MVSAAKSALRRPEILVCLGLGLLLSTASPLSGQANANVPTGKSPELSPGDDPPAPTVRPRFGIGMDGSLAFTKVDFPGAQRATSIWLPMQRMRFNVNFGNRFQLEFPVSLSYFDFGSNVADRARVYKTAQLAAIANANWIEISGVRSFIGGGVIGDYTSTPSRSRTRFGALGQLGLDVPINPVIRFRPSVSYSSLFKKESDDLPAVNTLALNLGMDWECSEEKLLWGGPRGGDWRGRYGLRVGFEGMRETFGSYGGGYQAQSQPSQTSLFFPSPYIGVTTTLTPGGRLVIGSNFGFNYYSQSGQSDNEFSAEPRVEFNFNPRYSTRPSVRIGALMDIDRQSSSQYTGTKVGFGGDAAITLPMRGPYLGFIGAGYTRELKNDKAQMPASNRFSLKFGADLLL